MPWWNFLTGGVAELVKAGTGVVTAIAGYEAAKDQQLSSEQVALSIKYAAEFVARQQRSLWDLFVDGVNRLVRPGAGAWRPGGVRLGRARSRRLRRSHEGTGDRPDPLWVIWGGILGLLLHRPHRRAAAEEVEAPSPGRSRSPRKSPPNAPSGARPRRRRGAEPAATPPAALPAPAVDLADEPAAVAVNAAGRRFRWRGRHREIRCGRWRRPSGARREGEPFEGRSPSPG